MLMPTMDDLNVALAEEEAASARRWKEIKQAEKARAVEHVPSRSEVVDVMRETLPPRAPEPEPPKTRPVAYFCPECGLVFSVNTYKTNGMTIMSLKRHVKQKHPTKDPLGI